MRKNYAMICMALILSLIFTANAYSQSADTYNTGLKVKLGGTVAAPVDLGLSVKWASHNIGASRPEEAGGLYGWGDPTGMKTHSDHNGDYCYGLAMDIQDSGRDIAFYNWGLAWMMPSKANWDELISNCNWEEATLNGVEVVKITGPNGNCIYLPYTGKRLRNEIEYKGLGRYWTSTPDANGLQSFSYTIEFYSNKPSSHNGYQRCLGQAVRPVTKY